MTLHFRLWSKLATPVRVWWYPRRCCTWTTPPRCCTCRNTWTPIYRFAKVKLPLQMKTIWAVRNKKYIIKCRILLQRISLRKRKSVFCCRTLRSEMCPRPHWPDLDLILKSGNVTGLLSIRFRKCRDLKTGKTLKIYSQLEKKQITIQQVALFM